MKGVIFDFDGTIADTRAVLKELNEVVSKEYGLRPLSQAEIDELRKKSIAQIIKYVKIPPKIIPKLMVRVPQLMHQRIDMLKPYKDMPAVLNELSRIDGLSIGLLSSNTKSNIYTFLEKHGMLDKFNFLEVGVSLFGKHKKIRQALKKHRLDAKQTLYVGDEIRDIEAAHKVPMSMIAVPWGLNHPDLLKTRRPEFIVEKPKQIVDVVKRQLLVQ